MKKNWDEYYLYTDDELSDMIDQAQGVQQRILYDQSLKNNEMRLYSLHCKSIEAAAMSLQLLKDDLGI